MNRSRLIAAALLTSAMALPAAAEPVLANNCRVRVSCVQTPNGVYAMTTVDSLYGLEVDADIHVIVNGEEVKMEPVVTSWTQTLTTHLATSPGSNLIVCANVVGRNWVNEESSLPVDVTQCAFFSPESTNPRTELDPRAPERARLGLRAPRAAR